MFDCPSIKRTNLRVIAHDQVSELHDFVVDGGPVPLLDDVVGRPPLALLHHSSWAHSSSHYLALIHAWSGSICALGGAWL